MSYIVSVDGEKCIGCGACTNACDNFRMDGSVARPVRPNVKDVGCNQQAADICPVGAITIGKRKKK